MEEDLESQIRNWLEKQGYPLEMIVARALRWMGANVSQSTYYMDPETEKPREIEVTAEWHDEAEDLIHNGYISFQLSFLIECKSQQKGHPWIVFSDGEKKRGSAHLDFIATRDGKNLLSRAYSSDPSNPVRMEQMLDSINYGVTQAFQSKLDLPYEAVMSSVKAATAKIRKYEKFLEEYSEEEDALGFLVLLNAAIAIPIVVTDAPLFECFLDENNLPVLVPITSCCLEWKYPLETKSYSTKVIPVYIYNAENMDQLVNDVMEIRQELPRRLGPYLSSEIEHYFKGHD